MPKLSVPHPFLKPLASCCAALLSAALLLAACTGNGGAANSNGDVYTPGGGGTFTNSAGNGSSSGAPSGASSNAFTAQDLLNLSNAGDAEGIARRVSGDTQTTPESCTIVLSASDLGLPSGGTVRLAISGIGYDETVTADADGNVRLEVPLIPVDSTVTVELSVMDADGTVLWYGSKTEQVTDGFNLDITLESQVSAPTPPAEVIMKTGPNIKTALQALGADSTPLKTFAASPTPPADGAATQKLSTDDSPVEVLAWCEGTSIKYYAAGYTDASPAVKIPLKADSSNMFLSCSKLSSIDLSGFDTSNVLYMSSMFCACSSLTSLNVSGFNTSKVKSMRTMFAQCSSLTSITGLSGFDTGNVTNMNGMFDLCSNLTGLDLSSFNTGSVTDMATMFYGCSGLVTIYASAGPAGFTTANVEWGSNIFADCAALQGGAGTAYDPSVVDTTYARIDGDGGLPGYFTSH